MLYCNLKKYFSLVQFYTNLVLEESRGVESVIFSPNGHMVQDINLNLKNYFTFVTLLFLKMHLNNRMHSKKLCQVKRKVSRKSIHFFPRHFLAKFQKVKSSVHRILTSTYDFKAKNDTNKPPILSDDAQSIPSSWKINIFG